jgi:hypothetical protein
VGAESRIKARKTKVATNALGGYFGGGGGGGSLGNSGYSMGTATNVYSPHLSTDFLELPQNRVEERAYFRFFYNNEPYVGQAIDLHTELPLSKLRLTLPKGSDYKKNREILQFFQGMVDRTGLLNVLIDATREYYVIGEGWIFAEDSDVEVPEYVYLERVNTLDPETGATKTELRRRENADKLIEQYKEKNYQGWDRIMLLPPDQIDVDSFQYSSKQRVELIPDEKTKEMVKAALRGDPDAAEALEDVPEEIIEYIANNENLPLGTDPAEGSFVYQLARKKPPGQDHGVSILQRCLRTLVYRDKLRQAQTSIASRAMTPKRLIYAEDMDDYDVEDLREQVDMALLDPDYSIITNFQVNWEEINARDRLLDLNGEYDITDRQLFAGLGVTESMLTGESTYSGERINIEVINTRYMLYRELLQTYVEEYLFKPVAEKKGFVEYDEFGNKQVLYPSLSFTRLALRDNRDTFDAMFNLYQKGSLSVGYILELFNLDPQAVEERLSQDLMTVNDALFNEVMRSAYSEVGRALPEQSDIIERIVDYLKLEYRKPPDENSRY